MAQESQGNPYAEADDAWGSIGILQVGPRPWFVTREQLRDPVYNIYKGMDLLADTLRQSEDIRHALAGYNCGLNRLANDLCGRHGGWAYADKVLDYWLPVFRAELTVRAGENDLIGNWLATLGYREGLGQWEVMPEIEQEESEECIVLPARRFRPRMCI